jgi:hypothetical protein
MAVTTINYRVMPSDGAWLVAHDDDVIGPYPTRAAAGRAAIGPISAAIARGHAVSLTFAPATTQRAKAWSASPVLQVHL